MSNPIFNLINNLNQNQNQNPYNNQMNQFNSQNNNNINQGNLMNQFNYQNDIYQDNPMNQMINICRNYPEILKKFNEIVTKNNINYCNDFFDEDYIENASQGNIPRRIFKQKKENNKTYSVETNDSLSLKINIKFSFSAGNFVNLIVPNNMKVKDLFISFITKMGFDKDILKEEIYFLFDGSKMDINEELTIEEKGLFDHSVILVLDTKGILGGKNLNLFIKFK